MSTDFKWPPFLYPVPPTCRDGEADNPGPVVLAHPATYVVPPPRPFPPAEARCRTFNVCSANVTHLLANSDAALSLPADVLLYQEHTLANAAVKTAQTLMRDHGVQLALGPLDPELTRTGGVGMPPGVTSCTTNSLRCLYATPHAAR